MQVNKIIDFELLIRPSVIMLTLGENKNKNYKQQNLCDLIEKKNWGSLQMIFMNKKEKDSNFCGTMIINCAVFLRASEKWICRIVVE